MAYYNNNHDYYANTSGYDRQQQYDGYGDHYAAAGEQQVTAAHGGNQYYPTNQLQHNTSQQPQYQPEQYGGYDQSAPGQYGEYDQSAPGQYGGYGQSAPGQYGGYNQPAPEHYGEYDQSAPEQYGGYDQSAPAHYASAASEYPQQQAQLAREPSYGDSTSSTSRYTENPSFSSANAHSPAARQNSYSTTETAVSTLPATTNYSNIPRSNTASSARTSVFEAKTGSEKIDHRPMLRERDYRSSAFFDRKRGSCRGSRVCGCVCCMIVLLIIAVVAAALLWARVPQVQFMGVAPSPLGLPAYAVRGTGFDFNLGLQIQVNNPNFVGATFTSIKAVAFYPGHEQAPIGGGNKTDVHIDKQANTTIIFPFSINYDTSLDPGLTIWFDLATKCGLTGGTKQKITVKYTLTLSFKVILMTLSPSFDKEAAIDCPIQNGQIPNIPGLDIGRALGTGASAVGAGGKGTTAGTVGAAIPKNFTGISKP